MAVNVVFTGTDQLSGVLQKINGNTDQVKNNLNRIGTSAGKGTRVANSSVKSVGASLGSLASRALKTAAVIGGPAIVLKQGFERLKTIDDAKAKLSGLGNSSKQVATIMQNANKAVTGTMFGMGEAATTSATAVAAGIKPGKDLTHYLTLIGDAATIGGTSMSEMGSIFNKVAAGGKVDAEVMNQLSDRGIPAWSLLAKSAGKSVSEIRQDVTKGKIGINDFTKAMEKGMGGAAKKMGDKSFTAAFANMKASIGRIGANLLDGGGTGDGIFSQLKKDLPDITKFLNKVEKNSKEIGRYLGGAFSGIISGLGSSFKTIGTVLSTVWNGVQTVGEKLGIFKKGQKNVDRVKKAAELLTKAFLGGVAAVATYKTAMKGIQVAKGIKETYTKVKGIADKIGQIAKKSPSIGGGISSTSMPFANAGGKITGGKSVIQKFGSLGKKAGGAFAKGLKAVSTGLKAIGSFLSANPLVLVAAAIAIAAILIITHWKQVKGFFKNIGGWFKKRFGTVKEAVTGSIGKCVDKFKEFQKKVKEIAVFIARYFVNKIKHALNTIKNAFRTVFDKIGGFIGTIKDKITGFIDKIKQIPSAFSSLGKKVAGKVKSFLGFRHGTTYAPGGLSVVGENGPELVNLPRGSQVRTAGETRRILSGAARDGADAGNTVNHTVHISKLADRFVVREEADIDKIAEAIARKMQETDLNMA